VCGKAEDVAGLIDEENAKTLRIFAISFANVLMPKHYGIRRFIAQLVLWFFYVWFSLVALQVIPGVVHRTSSSAIPMEEGEVSVLFFISTLLLMTCYYAPALGSHLFVLDLGAKRHKVRHLK
jgi:hypothetical protein